MITKAVFIIIGLIIGLLQYGLIKTAAKYTAEKKGGVAGIVLVKFLLYAMSAAVVFFLFKEHIFLFAAGVATGIVITAITDMIRNKK